MLHYYKEPYPFTAQKIVVIGAKNSAAKVALECVRHGADVTLVHRGPRMSDSVKYWIKPDVENRIKEGRIKAYFDTSVARITETSVHVEAPEGPLDIPADWVLTMRAIGRTSISLQRWASNSKRTGSGRRSTTATRVLLRMGRHVCL